MYEGVAQLCVSVRACRRRRRRLAPVAERSRRCQNRRKDLRTRLFERALVALKAVHLCFQTRILEN